MDYKKDIGLLYENILINEVAGAINYWLTPDGELLSVKDHVAYAVNNFSQVGQHFDIDTYPYPAYRDGTAVSEEDIYDLMSYYKYIRVVENPSNIYFTYSINEKPSKKQFVVMFNLANDKRKNLVDGETQKVIVQNNAEESDSLGNNEQLTKMDQDLQPSFYKNQRKYGESYEDRFPMRDYTKLIYEDFNYPEYMEGNCALLALKINDIMGWPINILSNPEGDSWNDEDDFEFTHIVVEHPSGKYLDCKGLRTNQEISNDFNVNYLTSYDISREQLKNLIEDPDGPFDTYLTDTEVEKFAKKLLKIA